MRQSERRNQSSKESKVKEQQPDKMEIVKRLEREKKAVMRKENDNRKAKTAKPQMKPKRANNIDWTREYENDSYDDDEFDMYY